jgi:hypothetical protein
MPGTRANPQPSHEIISDCYAILVRCLVREFREKERRMVMMLPFVTGTLAVWFGLVGRRRPCVTFWLLTLVIFAAWCNYHMTSPLALSL